MRNGFSLDKTLLKEEMAHMEKSYSFKAAAKIILQKNNRAMSAEEITEIALEEGMISTEGKTPVATMGAQLYQDTKYNEKSEFERAGRGLFILKSKRDTNQDLPTLINNHNRKTREQLKEILIKMDPFQFEYLVGDLLKEIGYDDIEVTKRSGDKGIDIYANLTLNGITSVKTIVQVKRKSGNISNDVISQIRGSAEADQRSMVITTSDFTKSAIEEAHAQSKIPVGMINGDKLIDLMFQYKVGMSAKSQTVYYIDNSYFESKIDADVQETRKQNSIWPLPGGVDSYVETLNKLLEEIQSSPREKKQLVKWFITNFENVTSENSAASYVNVAKLMGLVYIKNTKFYLSEIGSRYFETRDKETLYQTIIDNIIAVEEIYEFLKSSDKPQSEKAIHEYITDSLNLNWQSYAQISYRLLWLLNLDKIKKEEGGYVAL